MRRPPPTATSSIAAKRHLMPPLSRRWATAQPGCTVPFRTAGRQPASASHSRPRRRSSENTNQSSRSSGRSNRTSLNRRTAPTAGPARDPVGRVTAAPSAWRCGPPCRRRPAATRSARRAPPVRGVVLLLFEGVLERELRPQLTARQVRRPPALSGPPSIRSASCSKSTANSLSGIASGTAIPRAASIASSSS